MSKWQCSRCCCAYAGCDQLAACLQGRTLIALLLSAVTACWLGATAALRAVFRSGSSYGLGLLHGCWRQPGHQQLQQQVVRHNSTDLSTGP